MICPNLRCGRTVVAADNMRGKVVRCAHCQMNFMVPQAPRGTERHDASHTPESAAPGKSASADGGKGKRS